jgi:phosphoenolpyruvate synthase/pyruvate phosphate dikinase
MLGTEYTIELHDDSTGFDYEVDVEITHFLVVKPNSNADNPDDYYGYNEIEFDVCGIFRYDSMGNEVEINWLPDELERELQEEVEELALKDYEEEQRNGIY